MHNASPLVINHINDRRACCRHNFECIAQCIAHCVAQCIASNCTQVTLSFASIDIVQCARTQMNRNRYSNHRRLQLDTISNFSRAIAAESRVSSQKVTQLITQVTTSQGGCKLGTFFALSRVFFSVSLINRLNRSRTVHVIVSPRAFYSQPAKERRTLYHHINLISRRLCVCDNLDVVT